MHADKLFEKWKVKSSIKIKREKGIAAQEVR
jgi:hypothetical protein